MPQQKPPPNILRDQRLAASLRSNLQKRKAQIKARREENAHDSLKEATKAVDN